MTSILGFLALAQVRVLPKVTVTETLLVARAVATTELAPWRKAHPSADLTIQFADETTPRTAEWTIRKALGYKNPVPVLDPRILTLVFSSPERTAAKRITLEAYVFLGSFPNGFRARYLVGTDGKEPKVVRRTFLERYEMRPPQNPTSA